MKNKSEKLRSRIVDIHDSLVLKEDGAVHLLLSIPSTVISSKDEKGRFKYKSRQVQAFGELEKYVNFETFELSFSLDLANEYRKLSKNYYPPCAPLAIYANDQITENLNIELGRPYEYQSFVTVPLKTRKIPLNWKKAKRYAKEELSKQVVSLFNKEVGLAVDWYEEFIQEAKAVRSSLMSIGADFMTSDQTAFVFASRYLKGLNIDSIDIKAHLSSSYEAIDEAKLYFLKEGIVGHYSNRQFGYSKSLPIIADPTVMNGQDIEAFFHSFNFEISTFCRATFASSHGVNSPTAKGNRARKRAKNASKEAEQADSRQKTGVIVTQELAEYQEQDVEKGKKFLDFVYSIEIYGSTPEEIWEKETILMAATKDTELEISSGKADQEKEFSVSRITEGHNQKLDVFVQSQPLESFCEHLWFANNSVGSKHGFYIGRVVDRVDSYNGDTARAIEDSNKLVFFNMYEANKKIKGKKTDNGHILIIGETGSGKSYLTKLLFLCHSLLRSQTLYIDPKAEMRKQYMDVLEEYESQGLYPELCDYIRQINFVTLKSENEENHGALDPFVFAPSTICKDLAETMVAELLGDDYTNSVKFKNAFLRTVDELLLRRESGEQIGFLHVFDELEKSEFEEVVERAELTLAKVNNSVLQLAFSYGENRGLDLEQHMTVLEVWGLDLPKNGGQAKTQSQIKSLVLMYALGYFCRAFGERSKAETSVFVDEAWFMMNSEVGDNILTEARRTGRSYNNFLVLVTQSLKDTTGAQREGEAENEKDDTGFGTVFAFNTVTKTDRLLKYLKVPVNDDTLEWVDNMTQGECIMKDVYGHIERVVIDGMLPEVTKLFDTVETDMDFEYDEVA
ncbi:ATP-binding protein [Lactococcus lactis]|uniref:ATP-binding protein n=1 Tax=Lactococcus lactis TaxID=1358 RepID=A0AAP5P4C6_9LACT|nr:ATP-binding protein [Lactococcus lactis]MDT2858532.1 ATP-binding protein [Lactococcus lactis]MDT2877558.1 ATP-binding protein [Lactococcus lactis]MDT2880060.1 ATP-binding protein [Lactococcus lactis]MDT2883282.1 ATP-binding protein [Lactococcus lactis]MDT2886129.1 ATP-binding protein [Lactococcus lactis]